jgi:cell division protein FtsW (lipid II flippase)
MRRRGDTVVSDGLLIATIILVALAGLTSSYLARDGGQLLESPEFRAGLGYSATLAAVWGSLWWGRYRGDRVLLPVAGMLGAIGLIVAVRLEPDLRRVRGIDVAFGDRQLWYLCAGLLLLWAVAFFAPNPGILARYRYTILFAGIALLGITAILGTSINGARLWISAGPVVVQTTELVKLALIVFLAAYLSDNLELVGASWRIWRLDLPPVPYLAPMAVMSGLCTAALIVLNDLGTALLFFSLFLILLYAANGRVSQSLMGIGIFALVFCLAYLLTPRVRVRVGNWVDPWQDPFVQGYQQIQAEFALGSGGIFGAGIGRGSPWLIPIVENDYVIAAIGEEMGLVAVIAVLVLYMIIATRGVLIARNAPTSFLKLLALGLTAGITSQAVIILAGVLRLMPLTGVTLPFISYGGSSILVTALMIGGLMRVSAMGQPASLRTLAAGV